MFTGTAQILFPIHEKEKPLAVFIFSANQDIL